MNFIKQKWMPLVLLIGGLLTRFVFIWWPNEVVFDEVHFGKFVSGYFNHEYFFDIHPPLGKLLVALAAWVGGFNAGFSFDEIGRSYGEIPYIALRFLPNLAGALIPIAAFWFFREISFSKLAAFFAAALILLDNAMLVQSHFILVDSFLILFGLLGLAAFFRARNLDYHWGWLATAGLLLALSFSVKWTGLTFLGGALLVILGDVAIAQRHLFSHPSLVPPRLARWLSFGSRLRITFARSGLRPTLAASKSSLRKEMPPRYQWTRIVVSLVVLPIVIYAMIFWVHFSMLPKSDFDPTRAAGKEEGNDKFMSVRFRSTLRGSPYFGRSDIKPPNFFEKFVELNAVMLTANAGLKDTHPYASKFYTWPLMVRPIYYWVGSINADTARIYLLGNPVVWWLATIFGALAIFFWKSRDDAGKKWRLLVFWILNFVPFAFVDRVVFLYHYLPALIFAVGILAGWLDEFSDKSMGRRLMLIISALAAIAFVFFAPLSYGLPLSDVQYKLRVWLSSWI